MNLAPLVDYTWGREIHSLREHELVNQSVVAMNSLNTERYLTGEFYNEQILVFYRYRQHRCFPGVWIDRLSDCPQHIALWSVGGQSSLPLTSCPFGWICKWAAHKFNIVHPVDATMTSSTGNIFALLALCAGNSPVTGEFSSQRPAMQSFDVFFDLRLNKRLSKQSRRWWFETPSCSLWCHCNGHSVPVILFSNGLKMSYHFQTNQCPYMPLTHKYFKAIHTSTKRGYPAKHKNYCHSL